MDKMIDKLLNIKFLTSVFVGIILFIFTLIFLFSNWYKVGTNEYAVVKQFGEIVKIIDKAGPQFKVPLIQNVEKYPKEQLVYNVAQAEINTKDKKRMLIDNFAIWEIEDPKMMVRNLKTVANAESKMGEIIYSIVREEFGSLNYDQILSDEANGRGELADVVTQKVNTQLKDGNYGVKVKIVAVKRTDLPLENENSVYTRMISERESTAQNYLSKGESVKQEKTSSTDKEASLKVSKAEKEAKDIIALGEKEAARIYSEAYSKDAEFYKLYRTLESYKTVINDETVIILPHDSEYAKLLLGK